MRRMLVGMSQEKLGEALGLTFQQVQKYEKGTNRIGASRLHQIGTTLGVPVAYFYEGLPEIEGESRDGEAALVLQDFLSAPEGLRLAKSFVRLTDDGVRRKIVELVESLAPQETDLQEERPGAVASPVDVRPHVG
jgi:transcriptional regulator with XRE-family HTH domain